MRTILALMAASWHTMLSYRLRSLLSLASLLVTVVPLYFIAGAVEPIMGPRIAAEGGNAFGFLLVGTATLSLVAVSLDALPSAVGGGIATGTLEALLVTPARVPVIFAGLASFSVAEAAIRAFLMCVAGIVFGVAFTAAALPWATLVIALLVVAHAGVGLVATSFVIAFRTAGPLSRLMLLSSSLLGGVYYPTSVIPSWLQLVSDALPMSYGLRALRPMLLQGAHVSTVAREVGVLAAMAVVLCAVGVLAIRAALRFARRAGTLSQY
jgi:ABC-2 type transport system permease protein